MGPYIAKSDGKVSYNGNNLFCSINDVRNITPTIKEVKSRLGEINKKDY